MSKYKRICFFFLHVGCLYGLIAYLLWLILRPRTPTFFIIDLDILALTHQDAIPAVAHQNHSITFSLEIYNPNKRIDIYYNSTDITFHFSNVSVGAVMVGSFHQDFRERTQINGSMNLMNRKLLKAIFGADSNTTIDLEVNVVTVVRYRIFGSKTRRRRIDVWGHVPIGSQGQMNETVKIIMTHHIPVLR
eukprot:TRINITY_DN15753_c0_g1_i1.p1 TRINITY_DN15753_c0_g1~~TRINITY_DN15753_c0_g1_i1.p1  ORF type:complete len:190 (-),score=6.04 TRINITY_DN15753_c0_g1_i1:148-717(-)